jgi:hypothetical protein
MATKKVTQLATATSAAAADLVMIVDVADTAMSPEGTNKQITTTNFLAGVGGDDHISFNGGGYIGTANEMAITFGMSSADSTSFNYLTTLQIPIDCRLVSVRSFSQSSAGSTDVSAYKPTSISLPISSYTALGTVNIASHTAATSHLATFDSVTYDYTAGENIGITFDSTTNLSGLIVTILLKKT